MNKRLLFAFVLWLAGQMAAGQGAAAQQTAPPTAPAGGQTAAPQQPVSIPTTIPQIKAALENPESSKSSRDKATRKVEETSALVDSIEQDVKSYAEQVHRSDSLVRDLEKRT